MSDHVDTVISRVWEDLLEQFDEINARLDTITETQVEILEKLDNLNLPTDGFQTEEYR